MTAAKLECVAPILLFNELRKGEKGERESLREGKKKSFKLLWGWPNHPPGPGTTLNIAG